MNITLNGMWKDADGNRCLCNAHLYYKGKSVIIDYERFLHDYNLDSDIEKRAEGLVPFEVYPYENDIYVGYVHTDNSYKKADIGELISILDSIIKEEDKSTTYINSSIIKKIIRLIVIFLISLCLIFTVYSVVRYIVDINNKTYVVKNNNTRDYKYEYYCDSIYEVDPNYYSDVLVESDKYQSYIDEHGEWWAN